MKCFNFLICSQSAFQLMEAWVSACILVIAIKFQFLLNVVIHVISSYLHTKFWRNSSIFALHKMFFHIFKLHAFKIVKLTFYTYQCIALQFQQHGWRLGNNIRRMHSFDLTTVYAACALRTHTSNSRELCCGWEFQLKENAIHANSKQK